MKGYSKITGLPNRLGVKHTDEVKTKIRARRALQIISHSEETKRKIGLASTGKKYPGRRWSPEIVEKRASAMRGRLFTEEQKKAMRVPHPNTKGEKHWRWKGGYKNHLILVKRRYAQKRGAEGSHTLEQWEDLKKKYSYMCLCCKQQEPFIKLTEDHIIPIVKGGTDDISNIQPLCGSCNSKKYTNIFDYRLLVV